MTLKEITKRVLYIFNNKHDDEDAHAEEDELYLDFIRHVEEVTEDEELRQKARVVLKTQEIEFRRWCA